MGINRNGYFRNYSGIPDYTDLTHRIRSDSNDLTDSLNNSIIKKQMAQAASAILNGVGSTSQGAGSDNSANN